MGVTAMMGVIQRGRVAVFLALACAACLPACGRQKGGDIKRTAERFLTYLVSEDYTAAASLLEPGYAQQQNPDRLKRNWDTITRLTGQFKRERGVRTETTPKGRVVAITCEFEKRTMDLWLLFDHQGRIIGVRLVSPNAPSSGQEKRAPRAPQAPSKPARGRAAA